MKSITVAFAIVCILCFLNSCSSSKIASRGYFGEGGSSEDTLFIRAVDSPVTFIFEKNFRGEGGSSRETLYLKPKEYARFYKLVDRRKKK